MIIADSRLSDAATISTANTCAPSMPLSYLQKMQPTDRCRFTNLGEGDLVIDIDLTAAKTATGITQWNYIGLFYTNADSACQWALKSATSQANLTAAPAWTVAAATFWPSPGLSPFWSRFHGRLFLATARTEDWIRITISNAANPDGFFEAGRLYIADAYEPQDCNAEWGAVPDFLEEEKSVRSQGGQRYPRATGAEGIYPFTISPGGSGSHAEIYAKLQRIRRLRGTSRDVVVDLDPTEATYAMDKMVYGTFTSLQQLSYEAFESYRIAMTVQELR